ncbi:Structural maintenance of chromosomes protein 6 [Coemansia javaensis]|uniref:Structural maintenance of chromosomes protein 6 n=1 Tax=Coemansia javaensis TaxID=2761396 RepID=A0A9W8H9K5_9FUNG|nr:Structural maintenance of chromosomes protein 6 [Coemansia javaensis]
MDAPPRDARTGVTRLRERTTAAAAAAAAGAAPAIGIVERIEVVDFMCHERAVVSLCPKVNFITGQNGSGKSAILTALTIALGGKATTTNRAPNLREFIREGQARAVVRVDLRNTGPDAYRPELFGSPISIERQLNAGGSVASQYKIRSGSGEVVSRKKEDVVAITDHMAIQVDNPINILSQDAAREFLASTSPDKMYHFFLKGTQLFQLREDLDAVRQAIARAEASIARKREVLPEMRAEKRRWEQRYDDMRQARDLSAQLESLQQQLAWAIVGEAEAEVARVDGDAAVLDKKLAKVDDKVAAETAAIGAIASEAAGLEAQAREALARLEPLDAERRGPRERAGEARAALRALKQTEAEINAEARSTRERVEALRRDLDAERARLVGSDGAGAKERARARIAELDEAVAEHEAEIATLQAQQKKLEARTHELSRDHAQRAAAADRARAQAERTAAALADMTRQTSDQLSAFGRGVREALALIAREPWRGMPPVGPIGKFIRLRDPRWSRIIETTLDKVLNAFLVASHADRATLDALFRRCGCQSRIIVCSPELFDYSQGEPDPEHVTILRALDISDEVVKRQLININRIEQIILVEHRATGDKVMVSNNGGFPRNVTACLSADGYSVGARGGGLSTQAITLVRPSSRLGEDISQAIAREQQLLADHQRAAADAQRLADEARREMDSMVREHKRSAAAEKRCRERINAAAAEIEQARELLHSDEPAKIAALEAELESFSAQLESIQTQFRDHLAQQTAAEDSLRRHEADLARLDRQAAAIRDQADRLRQAADKKAGESQKHTSNIEYWRSKRAALEDKMQQLQAERRQAEARAREAAADAREVCPERVAAEHASRRLDQMISEARARLDEIERSSSMPLAEVAAKAQSYIDSYRRAKEELDSIGALVAGLKAAHEQRLGRWTQFRDSMAMRTKLHFANCLSQRGYTGKLEFDHAQCTLLPKVQTDQDLAGERASRSAGAYQRKDTRSLSGGEKSFTTICLLLSLWETMSCPVRALDEFDVFMDAANRKIAMSMMVGSARSQGDTQFILITPQDMSVRPDADVTIFRLEPPRRTAGRA